MVATNKLSDNLDSRTPTKENQTKRVNDLVSPCHQPKQVSAYQML